MKVTASGLYVQTCSCVGLRLLARKRAEHLREEADSAEKDAREAEESGDGGDAVEFRRVALEARSAAIAILRAARRPHPPCLTCAGRGEVTGNGTYGGPAHKPRIVVGLV